MSIIFIRTFIVYIVAILAVRIMGKRQIGELKPHELVITILVSETANMPLEDNNTPLVNMLVPIMLFVSFEIIVSAISMKSLSFRNILQGKPIFVIRKGKLDEKQLKRMRLTMDDLIDAVRQKDIFDISTVQDAVVETNGSISVLQKAEEAPVTPKQMKLSVKEESVPVTIVIDGKPVTEYFGEEKTDSHRIELIVKNTGKDIQDIMLLTVDDKGNTFVIPKRGEET